MLLLPILLVTYTSDTNVKYCNSTYKYILLKFSILYPLMCYIYVKRYII